MSQHFSTFLEIPYQRHDLQQDANTISIYNKEVFKHSSFKLKNCFNVTSVYTEIRESTRKALFKKKEKNIFTLTHTNCDMLSQDNQCEQSVLEDRKTQIRVLNLVTVQFSAAHTTTELNDFLGNLCLFCRVCYVLF